MAVTGLRLDGQTIGIQLTAPDTFVDLFSLDMGTGVITSGTDSSGAAFLTDVDILNLKPGTDALFSLVPFAVRTAGAADALAFLTKLTTFSSASNDGITLSSVNPGGDVWTLRASIVAADGYLIAHLPFTSDGTIAWASGLDINQSGPVAGVTASAPLASSGGATPNISLTGVVAAGNGGTGLNTSGAVGNVLTSNGLGGWASVAPSGVQSVSGSGEISSTGGVNPVITFNVAPGAAGNVLTSNGFGAWTSSAAPGLTYWTESRNTAGVNATKNVSQFTPNVASTDGDAVIAPKGVGAILAATPDGTSTGGNKRGDYATDLQKLRTTNTQVASGSGAVIAGGIFNTSSGPNAVVGGGHGGTASGSRSTIAGGYLNTASADQASVGGGQSNTASLDHATVAGGKSNTASGYNSTVGGGELNLANADYATIPGGDASSARATIGKFAYSSTRFSGLGVGSGQTSLVTLQRQTGGVAPTVMTVNGAGGSVSNINAIPLNGHYIFKAYVMGVKPGNAGLGTASEMAAWEVTGAIKYDGVTNFGAAAIIGTPTVTLLGAEGGMVAASISIGTYDTYFPVNFHGLAITVVGLAGTVVDWFATVHTTELVY